VLLTSRFVGIFTSLLIPETKRKSLEELTGEAHYYDIEQSINGHMAPHSVEAEKNV